jgi:hypothetical protein
MKKFNASEVQRVAKDIVAIRSALHQYGYRTRKRHKEPVWVIFVNAQCYYLLTYRPAPLSTWELYTQGKGVARKIDEATASGFAIERIIQDAIQRRTRLGTLFRR